MDGQICDFRLVSTYIPFVATVVRAQVFTTFAYVIKSEIPPHIYCALLLNLTYFDALLHLDVGTSKVAGHLQALCFAWLTRKWSVSASSMPYAYECRVFMGVVWLLWVQMLVGTYTFRRRLYFSVVAVTVVNSAFVFAHICANMYDESILDTNARCLFFCVFCFVHFHAFQTRSMWDAKTHVFVGPHVAMHVLYLDGYFVLVSACVLAFMCVHVYLQHQVHAREAGSPKPDERTLDCEFGVESMSDLVAQLRAAKAKVEA
jgi:hypothetical protein